MCLCLCLPPTPLLLPLPPQLRVKALEKEMRVERSARKEAEAALTAAKAPSKPSE